MSGNNILLDTNVFIYFFEGRKKITDIVIEAQEIFYSVITEIELRSSNHLTSDQVDQIKAFLTLCQPIDVSSTIVAGTIALRKQHRFKIPDAIIIASALHLGLPLVSADSAFQKVSELDLTSDILA